MSGSNGLSEHIGGQSKPKVSIGKRSISDARQYSQLHYSSDGLPTEMSVLDDIYCCKRFTIEKVMLRLHDIREAFAIEAANLENEIERLNASLDGEADIESTIVPAMSRTSVSKPSNIVVDKLALCSVCGKKPAQTSLKGSSSGSSSSGNGSGGSSINKYSSSSKQISVGGSVFSSAQQVGVCASCATPVAAAAPARGVPPVRTEGKLLSSKRSSSSNSSSGGGGVSSVVSHSSSVPTLFSDVHQNGKQEEREKVEVAGSSARFSPAGKNPSREYGGSSYKKSGTSDSGGIAAAMAELELAGTKHNNNDDSPSPSAGAADGGSNSNSSSRASSKSSRFRSRLDSARHEHYFLEEF
jgi:hypothetical protein